MAQANAGIGFFAPAAIVLVFAIVPVVLVEGAVLRWKLPVGTGRAFVLALAANVASTILGAVIAVALDLGLGTATGSSGLGGPIGFTLSLALMFGISWWVEKRTVVAMSPAIPVAQASRAVLLGNAVTYAMLVVAVFVLVPGDEPYIDRSRMTEIINVVRVERLEVMEHHAKTGSFPPPRTIERPTANTLRLVREADGRISGFVSSRRAELDGKAVVYEPVVSGRDIVGWKCYAPELPLKVLPGSCRFRNAAEAVPVQ
jgi:hypothetical protein